MSSVDCRAAPFIRTSNDRPWVDPGATTRGRPGSGAAESSLRAGHLDWPWVKGKFISRDFACERIKSLLVCGLECKQHTTHNTRTSAQHAGRGECRQRLALDPAEQPQQRGARGGRRPHDMAQRRERVLGLEQRVLLQRVATVRDRRRLALEKRCARCGRRRDAVAATPSPPPVSTPPVSAISVASESAFASRSGVPALAGSAVEGGGGSAPAPVALTGDGGDAF